MTREIEIHQQAQRAEVAYAAWENADPLFEKARWLTYQAELARLEALHMEASGKQERAGFVLPWLREEVGA